MNKITIKKMPFKLTGDLIETGSKIEFTGIDRQNQKRHSADLDKTYVISTFPDIETRVCDTQTQEIVKLATTYPHMHFLSLTTDDVPKINKWCAAHGIENIDIWSVKNQDFGEKTNTLIPKLGKLTRGLMIIKDGVIAAMSFKKELTDMPDFEMLKKYL